MNGDGRTWWSERWLERVGQVVDLHGPEADRARRLVSRGEVGELEIAAGRISGRVRGERGGARAATVTVPTWHEGVWADVARALAGRAGIGADLLLGHLPQDASAVVAELGLELFPVAADLDDDEARSSPQRWVALHLAFAAALDADPFLLFAVRGRDRRALLAAMRAVRAGADPGQPVDQPTDDPLAGLVTDDLEAFLRVRGALTDVTVHPQRAGRPDALLRSLGDPPSVDDPEPLARLVERAADTAWRLAAGEGSSAADEEVLLAELRAQRMADADALATALGWDVETTRELLDRLYAEGTVLRTGTDRRARYRA